MSSPARRVATESARKVRVYTKTGDKGLSSLFDGSRLVKSSPVFSVLGTTDELNANIGCGNARAVAPSPRCRAPRRRRRARRTATAADGVVVRT